MKLESLLGDDNSLSPYLQSRRDFIKNLSIPAALLMLLGTGGCESILEQLRNRPIRRRVNPSSPDSVNSMNIYNDAINLMKGLPASDPRSWNNQAGIHGTVAGGFLNCQHRNWYFLPWHRAYLFLFEQICRKLTGEAKFGLPYWNWAIDNSIPSPFWNTSSNLFHSPRTATATSVANTSILGHSRMEEILDETNFLIFGSSETAQGPFESGPHNHIHGFVGGTMGSGGSPLDPIFWTHHCMIDYCWVDWNINRDHDNTDDPTWTGKSWTDHFVDAEGNPVEAHVVGTILMPFLSYQYEASQIGVDTRDFFLRRSEAEIKVLKARLEKGAAVRLDVKKRVAFSRGIELTTAKGAAGVLPIKPREMERVFETEQPDRALVNIGFAAVPQTSDFFVRVFVNKPDATPQTGVDDIHYAGSFSFFGTGPQTGGTHEHQKPLFLVDITKTLRSLRERGLLKEDEDISLGFVAVPVEPNRAVKAETLSLESLDLVLSPVTVTERR